MKLDQPLFFAQSAAKPIRSIGLIEQLLLLLLAYWAASKILRMAEEEAKKIGTWIAIIGGICLLMGYFDYSSVSSQLRRAMGGGDGNINPFMIAGGVAFGFGMYVHFLHVFPSQSKGDVKPEKTPEQRLDKIKKMRDAGAITEDEYQEMRKSILDMI